MTKTVAIAGAGALGLASACALAEAGLAVTVFDPAPLGANASGVAAGMLAPAFEAALDPAARPHFALLMAARDLWPAFAAKAGVELDRGGALAIGRPAWLATLRASLLALGAGASSADAALIATRAPDAVLSDGLLVAEDWRLDAPSALAALAARAAELGVVFRSEAFVPDGRFEAVVLATGAARAPVEWASELGVLQPIKGHILRAPGQVRGVVRGEGVYVVETEGGRLIGATMEPGRDDAAVDPDQAARLQAAGSVLFTDIPATPLPAAVGVRAATPDGLPLVGPSRTPGVFIAAGARRNGWLLAPLVGQMITAHILGEDPGPWSAALAASRF